MKTDPPSRDPRILRRRRRIAYIALPVVFSLLLLGELLARYGLGLGDPPLIVHDDTIAYYFKPSADYRRFGNVIHYNSCGSRSDDFGRRKVSEDEIRILCFGDSVLNGGSLTDQANLATSILQASLRKSTDKPLFVGNISAGGWGPVNQFEYARKFGFFDADVVVLVLNSSDAWDLPKFGGLDPINFPTRKPFSALYEGLIRYLPRYLHACTSPTQKEQEVSSIDRIAADSPICLKALGDLIALAQSIGATVLIAQHFEPDELPPGKVLVGHGMIRDVARQSSVECFDMGPLFEQSLKEGRNPYRDNIHPNDLGQALMAEAILPPVRAAIAGRVRP